MIIADDGDFNKPAEQSALPGDPRELSPSNFFIEGADNSGDRGPESRYLDEDLKERVVFAEERRSSTWPEAEMVSTTNKLVSLKMVDEAKQAGFGSSIVLSCIARNILRLWSGEGHLRRGGRTWSVRRIML